MILQLLLSDEAFVTSWIRTGKRLITGVTVNVPHQLRLIAEVNGTRSLRSRIVLAAILPQASISPIFTSMIVLDVIVESLRGLKAQKAWLALNQPTAAEMASESSGSSS